MLHDEGLDGVICDILGLPDTAPDLTEWHDLVRRVGEATKPTRVGIIGKYVSLPDAYLSVVEALKHAGFHHGCRRADRVDPGRGRRGPARRR